MARGIGGLRKLQKGFNFNNLDRLHMLQKKKGVDYLSIGCLTGCGKNACSVIVQFFLELLLLFSGVPPKWKIDEIGNGLYIPRSLFGTQGYMINSNGAQKAFEPLTRYK